MSETVEEMRDRQNRVAQMRGTVPGTPGVTTMAPVKTKRTTAGLRDALFDALDDLRGPKPDVAKAVAISKVAREIINIAKAEMDFHSRLNKDKQLCDDFMTGKLDLGSNAIEHEKKNAR